MLSVITLLVVLTLSILVTRVATVALTHTGLSKESAKFQARSAFTGVGFTTDESEKVVNHPVRRRILLVLMLLGNAGIVTAVSSLIVSFINVDRSSSPFWPIALLISGVLLLWFVANSAFVDRHLSNLISTVLKQYTTIDIHDFSKLLHLSGDYQISEVHVEDTGWLAGMRIAECSLRKEGISVLGINRVHGEYLGVPDGDTVIEAGDTLVLYGRADTLRNLSQREEGWSGDIEHEQQVQEQKTEKKVEKQKDESRQPEAENKRS
ncbi:MAG: TrkA C-terminal domain-containing protein [Desulfobulbaceae bacterium]|nr:TrkA C-terminal domain-containing protein [Desulfobulbaceae bacterium]